MPELIAIDAAEIDLITRAYQHYAELQPQKIAVDDPERPELATPNRLAYALGWALASIVVQHRFPTLGLDVLPVYHPETGWDRFLFTRRVSCRLDATEPADSRGVLWLGQEDAPVYTLGNALRLPLGTLCANDPAEAIRRLLYVVPAPPLKRGSHETCVHSRATAYPMIYRVVAGLIADYPQLVAAREIFVDEEQIDGAYHPLYLATGALLKGWTYDYFQLVAGEQIAFLRTDGSLITYETEPGTWRTVSELPLDDPSALRDYLRDVLKLGTPAPAADTDKTS